METNPCQIIEMREMGCMKLRNLLKPQNITLLQLQSQSIDLLLHYARKLEKKLEECHIFLLL